MNNERIKGQTINNNANVIDLFELFLKLKSQWKKIVMGFLVGALAGALYSTFLVTPLYKSTSSVYLKGDSHTLSLQDLQVGSQLTKDYEIIFTSRPILEKTISQLHLNMTTRQLASCITINNPTDSRILELSVQATSPNLAKRIVNSIMDNGIDTVNEIDSQEPYVIERGIADTQKVSLSRTKATTMGALLGFIVVVGLITLEFILNDTVHSADDIEKYLDMPVLAIVSEDSDLNISKKRKRKRR